MDTNDKISREALLAFIREQGEAQGKDYDWTLMLEDVAAFPAGEPRLLEPSDFDSGEADEHGTLPAWMEHSPDGVIRTEFRAAELKMTDPESYEWMTLDGWDTVNRDDLDAVQPYGRYWTGKPTEELRARTPWEDKADMTLQQLIGLRNRMLITMQPDDIIAYFAEADIQIPDSEPLLYDTLHRARLRWPGCPEELRQESLNYLKRTVARDEE